jgi:hypothetical protein
MKSFSGKVHGLPGLKQVTTHAITQRIQLPILSSMVLPSLPYQQQQQQRRRLQHVNTWPLKPHAASLRDARLQLLLGRLPPFLGQAMQSDGVCVSPANHSATPVADGQATLWHAVVHINRENMNNDEFLRNYWRTSIPE